MKAIGRLLSSALGLALVIAVGCGRPPAATPTKSNVANDSQAPASKPIIGPEKELIRPAAQTRPAEPEMSLRERAQAFLKQPIPNGVEYDPDAVGERVVREYAKRGKVELNAGAIAALEARLRAAGQAIGNDAAPQANYFRRLADLVAAIFAEQSAGK